MDAAREQAMAEALAALRTDVATLSAEVRFFLQRVDPLLGDHEQRIRELEKRPEIGDLPGRVLEVEKWQWRREALLALGSSGVGGAIVAAINTISGG